MRSIERIDVAIALARLAPTHCLHRAGHLEGQFVELQFALVVRNAVFQHQAAEVAVGTHVVEAVVVYAEVGQVRCHPLERIAAAHF